LTHPLTPTLASDNPLPLALPPCSYLVLLDHHSTQNTSIKLLHKQLKLYTTSLITNNRQTSTLSYEVSILMTTRANQPLILVVLVLASSMLYLQELKTYQHLRHPLSVPILLLQLQLKL
jgi:hypothetical protein